MILGDERTSLDRRFRPHLQSASAHLSGGTLLGQAVQVGRALLDIFGALGLSGTFEINIEMEISCIGPHAGKAYVRLELFAFCIGLVRTRKQTQWQDVQLDSSQACIRLNEVLKGCTSPWSLMVQ